MYKIKESLLDTKICSFTVAVRIKKRTDVPKYQLSYSVWQQQWSCEFMRFRKANGLCVWGELWSSPRGHVSGQVGWTLQGLTTKWALTQRYQCYFFARPFLNVTENPKPDYLCYKKSVPLKESAGHIPVCLITTCFNRTFSQLWLLVLTISCNKLLYAIW